MAKLEGFIEMDDEVTTCSVNGCEKKIVGTTVIQEKKKGLTFDAYHFWCEEHFKEVLEEDALQDKGVIKE